LTAAGRLLGNGGQGDAFCLFVLGESVGRVAFHLLLCLGVGSVGFVLCLLSVVVAGVLGALLLRVGSSFVGVGLRALIRSIAFCVCSVAVLTPAVRAAASIACMALRRNAASFTVAVRFLAMNHFDWVSGGIAWEALL
jgi:hypothetical protein